MFGSFFGDAVSVICQTFLHMDASQVPQIPGITTALWFNPVVDPMQMLMFSFLLGIIHLFTGLGIQAYMHIRDGHFIYAVYDVFSWYLLVGGGILALLSLDMMKDMAGFVLPPVFLTIGGICAAIGAVIILLFAGREQKSFKEILRRLRTLRRYKLFKRYSFLQPSVGFGTCHRRYCSGFQPDRQYAGRQYYRYDTFCGNICCRTRLEYRYKCAGRICSYKQIAVC